MNAIMSTIHYVNHKFREEIIVPLCSLTNNIRFLLGEQSQTVITVDGVTCDVVTATERHICDLEADIRRLYNMDVWSFVKRWYTVNSSMDSMHFLHIKLQKQ
jgi:hypothetical protein